MKYKYVPPIVLAAHVVVTFAVVASAGKKSILPSEGKTILDKLVLGIAPYSVVSSIVLLAVAGLIVNKHYEKPDTTAENADKIALLLIASVIAINFSGGKAASSAHVAGFVAILVCSIIASAM